ncbi:acetyl/propionyl/methylcrotonyl-CoA carboxylase subunit alpha [Desulfogranum mediterraneum]|uniref:acetyl/propionyl/methylcrotonyl-CoA carboxylase subunit alpha n=1 Tax=Desulfogranum mediterraneum TaxID=160661 RepID=UPI00042A4D1A|nr:acetyl-CoA carboxylase biotin carboxylase subunit [Desulfogranum mediterraneum]
MFEKILIANRGEIACRIIRTARTMGVRTVAVYSQADRESRHVQLADQAICIGPPPAAQSYLDQEQIIEAAVRSGAQAIHPGYGFLSENPEFAEGCSRAGLVFIGPSPQVIRAMGIKSWAKQTMGRAGIPVIPGYHGSDQDQASLLREAKALGFPLLIKADRGGGGKGIRRVTRTEEFPAALMAAQREAAAAFGDQAVILEQQLSTARHLEVQIFRDSQGNGVHLFERDCSLQRRHQKIIEESPAPGIDRQLREQLCQAALTAAHTIDYLGAGTVEFLVDRQGNFFFMEINTRLQVEHPVTEMITGLDLVRWQLLVAAGEPLPACQEEILCQGHGMEARIYAEDPAQGFLPSSGIIRHLREPRENQQIRVDSGIGQGELVSPYYDPILAKLIVRERSRRAAVQQLRRALEEYQIAGIATNIDFLQAVVESAPFVRGDYDIHSLDSNLEQLTRPEALPDTVLAAAGLAILFKERQQLHQEIRQQPDPYSPWNSNHGFRLNGQGSRSIELLHLQSPVTIEIRAWRRGYQLLLPSGAVRVEDVRWHEGIISARLDKQRLAQRVVFWEDQLKVFARGRSFPFSRLSHEFDQGSGQGSEAGFRAPMPGLIATVVVEQGQEVCQGDPLLSLEAMKMEYTISAPLDGVVVELFFQEGDQVDEGDQLLIFQPREKDEPE